MAERPVALERLLTEVQRSDRLVLLGDIVELLEGRARAAMATAAPILTALGERLGRDGQVILVPGNHDRPAIRGWLRGRGHDLELEDQVPVDASPALAAIVERLGPAPVEVRYPGVRLSEGVWATHGHYLDRHLVPVSAWGRLQRRGPQPLEPAAPWYYERSGRVHVSPLLRWLPRPVGERMRELASMVRATTMPAIHDNVLDPRIAPLTWRLLSHQMRRHAIPALARVIQRLGVQAEWVVFGHVHRLGPLPGEDLEDWRAGASGTRFANSGAWLYEPRLVARSRPPHPYWPGGAVVLEDGAAPRPVGLLDGLGPADFDAQPAPAVPPAAVAGGPSARPGV